MDASKACIQKEASQITWIQYYYGNKRIRINYSKNNGSSSLIFSSTCTLSSSDIVVNSR